VGRAPARAREAKEALALGKLPERAGFRLVLGEREATFVLKAETLALSGVALPTILTEGNTARPGELGATTATRRSRRRTTVEEDVEREADARAEVYYDRIDRVGEVEAPLEALYRDFLKLRLGRAWHELVVPAMRRWSGDEAVDDERYREARKRALTDATSKSASKTPRGRPSSPTKRQSASRGRR
jgi:hypothetical protein